MEIKPVGDRAVCVEFENVISIANNQKVHSLDRWLKQAAIPGIVETVPTYRTLIVHYDPAVIRYGQLVDQLSRSCENQEAAEVQAETVIELPVLYGGEVPLDDETIRYDGWDGRETALDMEEIMAYEKLTREQVIRQHSKNLCYVYFQAFAVGHSYVGNPEKVFTIPRRSSPRTKIPRGTIAIWADQTVLNGVDLPCGWNLIGRTPVLLYDERKDEPSYCQPGQWIRFVPITAEEYASIHREALAGTYQPVTYAKSAAKEGV